MASLVGRKLGSYQITELLGQGGMATVYKGYRDDIDRYVAVKVLPPHPGLDQQFIDRFKQEARTIARLQHPHILPLYDYGVQEDIIYLVMAYVDGGSLADRIERGPLPPEDIKRILRQIASALDYAHRQGVIHRDIKPDNILLDRDGNVLLADFGIAKLVDGGSRLTVTGGLVGTPAYMAPEQGSGEGVTNSSDIYSLGVVVYEMLTGKQPFNAETPMQVVLKHMTEPIPSLREVSEGFPPALEMAIQRALAKNPRNRYKTASEFADDFSIALHSPELNPNATLNVQPSPDPTSLRQPFKLSADNTPVPESLRTPTQPVTIVQQSSGNPLLLLGGFAIIAALLVAVVFLLLNQDTQVLIDSPTAASSPAANATALEPTAPVVAAAPTQTAQPTFGRLSFSTTNQLGDTVTLQVNGLTPPGSSEVYVVWLKNTATDDVLAIGQLTLDALGSGVLTPYIDPEGRTLPALYNAVSITREPELSDTPVGPAEYVGTVPSEVTVALSQIFLNANDGIPFASLSSTDYSPAQLAGGEKAGLLDSILAEAQKAAQHAGLAQRSSNAGGMHTHAEHTINILLGTTDDHNGNGRGENPGFGVGVTRLLDLMEAQLDEAASAPGSSLRLQNDLEYIRVCIVNTRARVDQMVALEQEMLAATDVAAVQQQAAESTRIANQLINGQDFNGSGQIDPFEDECGLAQIETFGLVVGALNLVEAQ